LGLDEPNRLPSEVAVRDCNDEQEHLFAEVPDFRQDGGGEIGESGGRIAESIHRGRRRRRLVMQTAREFLERRAGDAKSKDLLKYLRKTRREQPVESDRR
jgi:hypothetical protein